MKTSIRSWLFSLIRLAENGIQETKTEEKGKRKREMLKMETIGADLFKM
jgi:hypothetical protein